MANVDGAMEARLARLEADVHHIGSDIGDIKVDVRELRSDLGSTRRWILGTFGGGFLVLISALATGYARLEDRQDRLVDKQDRLSSEMSDVRRELQRVADAVAPKERSSPRR